MAKFEIGQLVTSKRTGLPGVGQIVGSMHARSYYRSESIRLNTLDVCKRWTQDYPLWFDQSALIYFVEYETPRKTCTIDEVKLTNPEATQDELEYLFEHMVPSITLISYPEDDLEEF